MDECARPIIVKNSPGTYAVALDQDDYPRSHRIACFYFSRVLRRGDTIVGSEFSAYSWSQ
jgi:hypothetical protein